jgi:hypothetical protein
LVCFGRRDNPEKELRLTVERGTDKFIVPVVPSRASDGGGRIGVQLATNGVISHNVAQNPITAVQMASREFNKLLGTVTNGAWAFLLSSMNDESRWSNELRSLRACVAPKGL